jgi:hypothetical protein
VIIALPTPQSRTGLLSLEYGIFALKTKKVVGDEFKWHSRKCGCHSFHILGNRRISTKNDTRDHGDILRKSRLYCSWDFRYEKGQIICWYGHWQQMCWWPNLQINTSRNRMQTLKRKFSAKCLNAVRSMITCLLQKPISLISAGSFVNLNCLIIIDVICINI